MKQLESSSKRKSDWNKYLSQVTQQTLNRNLDFLIDTSFQGVNRLFGLNFEERRVRESYNQYFPRNVERKDYNQPVKNNSRTNDLRTLEKLLLIKVIITQLVV